jgi:hypothetical protein
MDQLQIQMEDLPHRFERFGEEIMNILKKEGHAA